ncbi:hypothetical protein [Okeania sp. KiyG1]|uniref:hypothetical protein n=1 Tax=Okeania sp. KiyG1 TaxID=2720165 RepID=UPI00192360F3|nr:hypothetical protein [Okeania sp. KiyG1]GFZ92433.1 hypothetical protein CYANOKiyG1_03070 [Okeania sp. KiyG1]
MKIKSVLTTLIFGFISVLVNFAVTQKVFARTSDEISQLREAGVPVIMPSYTPQSFQLTNFTIHKSGGGEPYYKATYQGANRCLFSINGSKAGWGDNLTIIRTWVFNCSDQQ